MIKDKELERIDDESKKIIQTFDSILYKERNLEFTSLGKRNLQNKLINWEQKAEIIEDRITILNNLFIGLDITF